jgi:hypothetical protein
MLAFVQAAILSCAGDFTGFIRDITQRQKSEARVADSSLVSAKCDWPAGSVQKLPGG